MLRKILFTILAINHFGLNSQAGLNIRLPEMYSSQTAAIYTDDNYAYVMGSTFDTTRIAVLIGKLYKIDIENQEIVDVITINENPIEFTPRANMLLEKEGILHYLAHGHEWRDTVIDNQNVYSHYHHFEYDLVNKEWLNTTFPAYNERGQQFIRHRDAYLTENYIYLANGTDNYTYTDPDILITKLDYQGNVIWNKKYTIELGHGVHGIIVDQSGSIILCGYQFDLSNDRRSGAQYLNIFKLDSSDGSLMSEYLSQGSFSIPKAIIEDPRGGYIIGTDNAIFIEGGKYPGFPGLVKLNEELDSIVWKLQYSDSLSYAFWHLDEIISLGNNEFVAVGVSDDIIPYSHVGRIVKFTGDGELIFDKEIYNLSPSRDVEQRLNDVVPYKDGFLACGTILDYSNSIISPRQQGWVVYFNENGENDITSSSGLVLVETDLIKVYPNPTQNMFSLEFKESTLENINYKIYNIAGSEIKNGSLPKGGTTYTIDLVNMLDGTYVLSIDYRDTLFSELIIID